MKPQNDYENLIIYQAILKNRIKTTLFVLQNQFTARGDFKFLSLESFSDITKPFNIYLFEIYFTRIIEKIEQRCYCINNICSLFVFFF